MAFLNAFVALGVTIDATREEIQSAFRRRAREFHPDKPGGTGAGFRMLKDVADLLLDEVRKRKHWEDLRPANAGDIVVLHGLENATLNGRSGRAGAWSGIRVIVVLLGGTVVAVKPENVTKMSGSAATSAQASAFHDGWGAASASAFTTGPGRASAGAAAGPSWAQASATREDEPQEWEELRQYPGGEGMPGMLWPYCTKCGKWSGDEHRRGKKHQGHKAHMRWSTPAETSRETHWPPPPSASSPPPPPPPPPVPRPIRPIPNTEWTEAELAAAKHLLRNEVAAADLATAPGGIYSIFNQESGSAPPFSMLSEAQLVPRGRVLVLAIMLWTSSWKDNLVKDYRERRKRCMESLILANDWTIEGSPTEACYAKAAGDLLQLLWIHVQRLDSTYHFSYNAAQASFAEWIRLQELVFGAVGDDGWNEHGLADLCETMTVYLPFHLLHAYLECLANFHKLYWSHSGVRRCEFDGRVPCYKMAVGDTNFCTKHRS
jgi:hypothetical protein